MTILEGSYTGGRDGVGSENNPSSYDVLTKTLLLDRNLPSPSRSSIKIALLPFCTQLLFKVANCFNYPNGKGNLQSLMTISCPRNYLLLWNVKLHQRVHSSLARDSILEPG